MINILAADLVQLLTNAIILLSATMKAWMTKRHYPDDCIRVFFINTFTFTNYKKYSNKPYIRS